MKLFPPNSPAENLGDLADKFHTVEELLTTTADWVEKQQSVPENSRYFVNSPNLTPLKSLDELWSTAPSSQKTAEHAVLLITEETEDYSLGEIMLDLFALTKNPSNQDQLVVRKVDVKKPSGISIVKRLKVGFERGSLPMVIGVDRNSRSVSVIGKGSGKASKQVLKGLIYQHYKKLFRGKDLEKAEDQMKTSAESELPVTKVNSEGQSEEAIWKRRYVAHLLDAEIALEYSLSHEVGQRKVIGGRSLTALQNFLQVLAKYFPGQKRPRTIAFIKELGKWTGQHDDVIKGVDFAEKVKEIKERLGAFSHEQTSYIGCKGTSPNYGGYTCGLWTLWHMLTASHLDIDANSENLEKNRFVLTTMYQYVDSFFGCRDCSRHFGQMAENGKAITRDVRTVSDSVLWLWRAHNRVNQRLSGDITDDPGFPKMIFPDRHHCPNCYDDKVATHDLWQEFNKDSVRDFLLQHYSTDVEYEGLKNELPVTTGNQDYGFREKLGTAHKSHHVSHFYRVRTAWFISVLDISLCTLIYVASFLLLLLICYKLECCSKRVRDTAL